MRDVEHHINLVRYAHGIANDTCPLAEQCVVSAIEFDLGRLSLPQAGTTGHLRVNA